MDFFSGSWEGNRVYGRDPDRPEKKSLDRTGGEWYLGGKSGSREGIEIPEKKSVRSGPRKSPLQGPSGAGISLVDPRQEGAGRGVAEGAQNHSNELD